MFKKGAKPRAIYDRLKLEERDFDGSLAAVKRAVRRLVRERGIRPEDVAIPVETASGDIAQVDFGYVGKLYDPISIVVFAPLFTMRSLWPISARSVRASLDISPSPLSAPASVSGWLEFPTRRSAPRRASQDGLSSLRVGHTDMNGRSGVEMKSPGLRCGPVRMLTVAHKPILPAQPPGKPSW